MTRPLFLYFCLFGLLSSLALSSSPRRFLQTSTPISDENTTNTNNNTTSDISDNYSIDQELDYISVLMMGYNFFGTWQSTPNTTLPGFTEQEGMAVLASLYQGYEEILADFQFGLFIYDGSVVDQGIIRVAVLQNISSITNQNYSTANSVLVLNNTIVNVTMGDPLENLTSQECNANLSIYFLNKSSGEPFHPSFTFENDIFSFGMQVFVDSAECSISFNTSVLDQEAALDQTASIVYTIVMSAVAIFQCIACQHLITGLEEGHISARKISLGTVRLINSFDFFLCLINLGRFMENSLIVGFTAVPFAVLSLHFEFKLIVVVVTLQSRLPAMDTSRLNFSNCFWLLISMVSVIIGGVYGKPTFIYFVFAFTQMPQIIQNYILQQRQRWNCCFLLSLTVPKIGYLAYMLLASENIFRRTPHPDLFVTLMAIMFVQFLVLCAQTRRPRLCKKEDVFYKFYDVSDKESIGQDVCCICLEKLSSAATSPETPPDVKQDPKKASFLSSSTDVSMSEGQKQTMVTTPCNHNFHESCLKEWIKQKHECPYCRCNLPEMPGEEE